LSNTSSSTRAFPTTALESFLNTFSRVFSSPLSRFFFLSGEKIPIFSIKTVDKYKKSFPVKESFQYSNGICAYGLLGEKILNVVIVHNLFFKHVRPGLG
jgi:hypothetical protein